MDNNHHQRFSEPVRNESASGFGHPRVNPNWNPIITDEEEEMEQRIRQLEILFGRPRKKMFWENYK